MTYDNPLMIDRAETTARTTEWLASLPPIDRMNRTQCFNCVNAVVNTIVDITSTKTGGRSDWHNDLVTTYVYPCKLVNHATATYGMDSLNTMWIYAKYNLSWYNVRLDPNAHDLKQLMDMVVHRITYEL